MGWPLDRVRRTLNRSRCGLLSTTGSSVRRRGASAALLVVRRALNVGVHWIHSVGWESLWRRGAILPGILRAWHANLTVTLGHIGQRIVETIVFAGCISGFLSVVGHGLWRCDRLVGDPASAVVVVMRLRGNKRRCWRVLQIGRDGSVAGCGAHGHRRTVVRHLAAIAILLLVCRHLWWHLLTIAGNAAKVFLGDVMRMVRDHGWWRHLSSRLVHRRHRVLVSVTRLPALRGLTVLLSFGELLEQGLRSVELKGKRRLVVGDGSRLLTGLLTLEIAL